MDSGGLTDIKRNYKMYYFKLSQMLAENYWGGCIHLIKLWFLRTSNEVPLRNEAANWRISNCEKDLAFSKTPSLWTMFIRNSVCPNGLFGFTNCHPRQALENFSIGLTTSCPSVTSIRNGFDQSWTWLLLIFISTTNLNNQAEERINNREFP